MEKGNRKKRELQNALKMLAIEKGYANVTMKDIGEYVVKEGSPVSIVFEYKLKGGTPIVSSNPEQHSDISVPQSSVPSTVSTPSTPSEVSGSPVITGEDIERTIVIGVVAGFSLVAVVLLLVLGKKRKQI